MEKENIRKSIEDYIDKINRVDSYNKLLKIKKELLATIVISEVEDRLSNQKILIKNFLYRVILKKEVTFYNTKKNILNNKKKQLLKKLYNSMELDKFIGYDITFNRNIGKIPFVFFKNVEFSNRAYVARMLYHIFSSNAINLNYKFTEEKELQAEKTVILGLSQTLKNIEYELENLIKQSVKIELVGCGANGNVFKLIIDNKKFCYKVFFPSPMCSILRQHGGCAEPQAALYTKRVSPKNKYTQFYFGKFATRVDLDSFMITDFIEKNGKKYTNKEIVEYLKINPLEVDKHGNNINGIIVDFGGIAEYEPRLRDNKARKYFRILSNNIEYFYNKEKLEIVWCIKNENFRILKNYFQKADYNTYQIAINILKKYKKHCPDSLLKFLENILELPDNSELYKKVKIKTSDIIAYDFKKIIRKIKLYELELLTMLKPEESYTQKEGNAIVDIFNDRYAVYTFDKDYKIINISINKKNDNDEFINLFKINELDKEKISKEPFIEFLNKQTLK